jgi:hypothetical protein
MRVYTPYFIIGLEEKFQVPAFPKIGEASLVTFERINTLLCEGKIKRKSR